MAGYDFTTIEKKWQAHWADNGIFVQPNPGQKGFAADRPKFYVLDMFPYPSGAGLHVGHPVGYIATDIVSRYKRMKGFNVLHPMGYDAFGLPAEQYAVEHGVHPRVTTEKNVANIERQLKGFGFSYDWSRRLATTDVDYYRWTQWIFLQLYNSWFDPEANAARPIEGLIRKLESGQYVVDFAGNLTPAIAANRIPDLNLYGTAFGQLKFAELDPDQRRRLIDEYRLAYMAEVPVNWCPRLGTVLSNEEVTNEGRSDRGDFPVYRRALRQWMLRITTYAERLLDDLETLDWPEPIKLMQRNWIGKSVGAEVDFVVGISADAKFFAARRKRGFPGVAQGNVIRVYTTRPDTLFGATYMVLSPEHPLVETITTPEQSAAVKAYVQQAANRSELERTAESKDKTGVFTGAYAINPVTMNPIPVWVADYVLMGYGTGAIMAVPAHDTRDFAFARAFKLKIIPVVGKKEPEAEPRPDGPLDGWRIYELVDGTWLHYKQNTCIEDEGFAINSGKYDGLTTPEFKKKIADDLAAAGLGRPAVNYKLRDWLFSRQRYWGEPFPIVHCDACGPVALKEEQLPLELPPMEDFTPAASSDPDALPQPPLAKATEWVATTCPNCGKPARRETNTMPQWAGSCWYYLRYMDARNERAFVSPQAQQYWLGERGIDLYVGGAEHAVLHLLYARFWHKVLFDLGHVATREPFHRLFNQGMVTSFTYRDRRGVSMPYGAIDFSGDKPVLKESGEVLSVSVEKMSKSLKNVVTPDEVIAQYGTDTLRLYEMFMGPLEASKPWNTRDIPGVHRFLQRAWRMIAGSEDGQPMLAPEPDAQVERLLHRLTKKAGEDIEAMKFNTTIAAMMEFVNAVYRAGHITPAQAGQFVLVLAPFAPHMAEELWQLLGHKESLAREPWPTYDPALLVDATVELPVQVNGKLRGRITVAQDADQATVLSAALADAKVAAAIEGKQVVKQIVVPGKMVNLVVK